VYDRLSEISQMYIGSIENSPFSSPTADYNVLPAGVSTEDFDAATQGEDFGSEDVSYPNHGIRIIPTIDGRRPWADPVIPDLIRYDRAAREYSCSAVGMFHIIELSAVDAGEAFHVRALELSVIDAGRLN